VLGFNSIVHPTTWRALPVWPSGPVWDDKKGGATGFGANTLAKWVSAQG